MKKHCDAGNQYPLWSSAYWHLPTGQAVGAPIPCIDVVVANESSGNYSLVRFDLTPVAKETLRGTRQLQYVVGVETPGLSGKKYLWLSPNDLPKPAAAFGHRTLPVAIDSAVAAFNAAAVNDAAILLRGNIWIGTDKSGPGIDLAQMFDPESGCPSELIFSETTTLDQAVVERLLKSDVNKIIEDKCNLLLAGDPYVKIDPMTIKVRKFRIRASSSESLELTKRTCALLIQTLASTAEAGSLKTSAPVLSWNDTSMDNYVVCVDRVELPLGGKEFELSDKPLLGYLILASSLDEIRGAVKKDLERLEYWTLGAIVFAICSAVFVSWRLIRPLSRMTVVAQNVAKISRQPTSQSSMELEELLDQLPTGLGNEIGILSKQFDLTTRELIRSRRKAEEDSERIASKQREVEQAERERAVANEVNGHLVQLLGSVSHDMRQPLFEISGQAERLIKQSDLTDAHRERLRKILRGARELNSLVNDILDYKRFTNGDITLEVVPFELESLLEELKAQHEETAKKRNVEIGTKLWWRGELSADRMRLKRVLSNLISNALSATNNGEVHLQVTPSGSNRIEISVRDTGCGMNSAQQELVFKFGDERAKAMRRQGAIGTRKDANSTGLGLFISKQLIECMGGEIDFVSHEGKGTTFTVRLPIRMTDSGSTSIDGRSLDRLASSNVENPARLPEEESTIAFQKPGSHRRKVVIVDDDPKCTEILAEMLAEQGYDAKCVHDETSALEVIAKEHPDLVTLDVFMPQIDGWEILRRLKADSRTSDIPVIMVTVHPDQAKATVLGADGFVGKPVREETLHQAVSQALGTSSDACVLVVDDDQTCLDEMQTLLKPLGCRVLVARDGIEALDCIHRLPLKANGQAGIDLAIVDLFMPNMDGFALIERFGEMPETSSVPIIVLSGGVLTAGERAELLPHVKKFFGKGTVDLATLSEEIRRLLRRSAIDQPSRLTLV